VAFLNGGDEPTANDFQHLGTITHERKISGD
jgi:hypothetical protein